MSQHKLAISKGTCSSLYPIPRSAAELRCNMKRCGSSLQPSNQSHCTCNAAMLTTSWCVVQYPLSP